MCVSFRYKAKGWERRLTAWELSNLPLILCLWSVYRVSFGCLASQESRDCRRQLQFPTGINLNYSVSFMCPVSREFAGAHFSPALSLVRVTYTKYHSNNFNRLSERLQILTVPHYGFSVKGLEPNESVRKGHSCQCALQCIIHSHYSVVKCFNN